MTVLPFSAKKVTPTPTLNFAAATSACADDIGDYLDVVVNISPTTNTPFPIRFGISGTAVYDFDWKILGLNGNNELIVAPNASTLHVPIRITENLDPSHTFVLDLIDNGYTNIGPTDQHEVTCTVGADKPTAANTGFTGQLNSPIGSIVANEGDVVENEDLTGVIQVKGNNVTIRNCRVKGEGSNKGAIYMQPAAAYTGLLIEHCEVGNAGDAGTTGVYGIGLCRGATIRRCYIHDVGSDAIKNLYDSLVEECFVEKVGKKPGVHGDAMQTQSSGGSNVRVLRCNFFIPYPGTPDYPGQPYASNACSIVDLYQFNGHIIESCWMVGGNHTFYYGDVEQLNCSIKNCRIGIQNAGYFNNGPNDSDGSFNRLISIEVPTTHVIRSGNKWEDGPNANLPIVRSDGAEFNNASPF